MQQQQQTPHELSSVAMSDLTETYRYQPLPPGPDGIRLLHLLPSEEENAPIECKLISYSLRTVGGRKHLYEALSYVWSSEQKPEKIFIENKTLPITASLHTALIRLRDQALGRFLWIDAVCIDQGDDREKEHQIGIMAHIYSQASRTIVWPGEAADDSDRAIEDIQLAARDTPVTAAPEKNTFTIYVSEDDLPAKPKPISLFSRSSRSRSTDPNLQQKLKALSIRTRTRSSSPVFERMAGAFGPKRRHARFYFNPKDGENRVKVLSSSPTRSRRRRARSNSSRGYYSSNSSNRETRSSSMIRAEDQPIIALLARPWFRRIWVGDGNKSIVVLNESLIKALGTPRSSGC